MGDDSLSSFFGSDLFSVKSHLEIHFKTFTHISPDTGRHDLRNRHLYGSES